MLFADRVALFAGSDRGGFDRVHLDELIEVLNLSPPPVVVVDLQVAGLQIRNDLGTASLEVQHQGQSPSSYRDRKCHAEQAAGLSLLQADWTAASLRTSASIFTMCEMLLSPC